MVHDEPPMNSLSDTIHDSDSFALQDYCTTENCAAHPGQLTIYVCMLSHKKTKLKDQTLLSKRLELTTPTPQTTTTTMSLSTTKPTTVMAIAPVVPKPDPAVQFTTTASQVYMADEPKQGSKCCGCCCDFRRAVIIMNIILVVLELFVLIVMATGSWTYYYDTSTKELEDHMQPYSTYKTTTIFFYVYLHTNRSVFTFPLVAQSLVRLS